MKKTINGIEYCEIAAQHLGCGLYEYFARTLSDGSCELLRYVNGEQSMDCFQTLHNSIADAYDYVTSEEIDEGMSEADVYNAPEELDIGEFVVYYQYNE